MSHTIATVSQLLFELGRHLHGDWTQRRIIVHDTFGKKRYTIRALLDHEDEVVIEVRPEDVITDTDVPF